MKHSQLYTIIPGLVSIETNISRITGFYLAENLYFYHKPKKQLPFHYKLLQTNDITIPEKYDFRNGFYIKLENAWYYERKIGLVNFKFKYDTTNNTFYFNRPYNFIPIELGGIIPVGKVIADIINLELFLKGNVVFHGCAVELNELVVCLIGLGYNGKTTFVKKALDEGAKYISEDMVIVNHEKNIVYPVAPFHKKHNFARQANRELYQALEKNKIVKESKIIDKLFLIQNSTNTKTKKLVTSNKTVYDYLLTCSLRFLKNDLTRSIILEQKLTEKVFAQIDRIKNKKNKYKFVNLINFDFSKIINIKN